MLSIIGKVIQGYQVASGQSKKDRRFEGGTIRQQEPYLAALGFNLSEYFNDNLFYGTLNVDISPYQFELLYPEWTIRNVAWSHQVDAENFFFSSAELIQKQKRYKALHYFPDPKTKPPEHTHDSSLIEIIAEPITDLNYGDPVEILIAINRLRISEKPESAATIITLR